MTSPECVSTEIHSDTLLSGVLSRWVHKPELGRRPTEFGYWAECGTLGWPCPPGAANWPLCKACFGVPTENGDTHPSYLPSLSGWIWPEEQAA